MEHGGLATALRFLESWLDYRGREVDIPGFGVAIYHKDSVLFSRAYGLANMERLEPMTPQHVFGMASQTKMFTATAIMQLAERGQLRLDDYAGAYLPWLARHRDERFAKITIRQLLSHSAGLIRDGLDSDFWELSEPFPSKNEFIEMLLSSDIAFTPNTRLKYSNVGYALLGQIIEVASGQSFATCIKENITEPLKLTNTFADYAANLDPRLATGYGSPHAHAREPLWPRQSTRTYASAVGVHATAVDLCHFAAAHFFGNETLLHDESKREMQRSQWAQVRGRDDGDAFGLGFEIQHFGNRRVVGHSGHLAGYCSATFFDPYDQFVVAVVANSEDAPVIQMAHGIFGVLDWFAEHADTKTPANLARFNARLRNATAAVEIVATSKHIAAVDPDDWEPFALLEELEQIDTNTLRVTTPGSIFNEGELIRYTFADDVVQAVRYAGVTLLPEPGYYRAISSSTDKLFTLKDLQRADLRVGRVVAVERCSPGSPAPFHIRTDFGPQLGVHDAYLQALPPLVRPQNLRGRTVIGAVYQVWHFDMPRLEIVLIGIGSQTLNLPDTLLQLAANPNKPQTLPTTIAEKKFLQIEQMTHSTFFKLELLPEYSVEDNSGGSSLAAWIQGKYHKSLALLGDTPAWSRTTHNNKQRIRIRITDTDPPPYQQWEMEAFRRWNIPMAHEIIYLLPRTQLAQLNVPNGDMVIFNNDRAIINGYDDSHVAYSTFYDTSNGHHIDQFITIRQGLLTLAHKYGQKLEP